MQRVTEGDCTAFAELYDHYSTPLYTFACAILRDAGDAQDVLHDAFVQLWVKAAGFDPASRTPINWMLSIIRNLASERQHLRNQLQRTA